MSAPKPEKGPDVWDDLTRGELSREEEAVLRALAEESETAAVHFEAFSPLDAGFRTRTAERIEAQLAAKRQDRQRRRFAGLSAVVAAAAAILLFVVREDSALTPYSLEVSGGVSTMRGPESKPGPVSYDADSKLVLVAKPARPVKGQVVASVAVLGVEEAEAVAARLQIAPSGAVRIEVLGKDVPAAIAEPSLAVIVEREAFTPRQILRLARERDPRVLSVTLKRLP